jgi:hypothetical protein
MRIISLDLILGTPRLQRRIKTELEQLPQDIAAVRNSGRLLRQGIAHTATSLPALAISVASGFVVGKIARAPRRQINTSALTNTFWWQLLMPLVSGWIQAKFAAPEPEQAAPDQSPTP